MHKDLIKILTLQIKLSGKGISIKNRTKLIICAKKGWVEKKKDSKAWMANINLVWIELSVKEIITIAARKIKGELLLISFHLVMILILTGKSLDNMTPMLK